MKYLISSQRKFLDSINLIKTVDKNERTKVSILLKIYVTFTLLPLNYPFSTRHFKQWNIDYKIKMCRASFHPICVDHQSSKWEAGGKWSLRVAILIVPNHKLQVSRNYPAGATARFRNLRNSGDRSRQEFSRSPRSRCKLLYPSITKITRNCT